MNKSLKIAKVISKISDPFVLLAIIGILYFIGIATLLINDLSFSYKLVISSTVGLTLLFFAPQAYMIIGKMTGFVSDLKLQKLRQRELFFIFTTVCWIISGFVLSYVFQDLLYPEILAAGMLIMAIVTPFWRLSGHMLLNCIIYFFIYHTLINSEFVNFNRIETTLYWLVILIWLTLVGWARVKEKKHTIAQVIAGSIVGALLGITYLLIK